MDDTLTLSPQLAFTLAFTGNVVIPKHGTLTLSPHLQFSNSITASNSHGTDTPTPQTVSGTLTLAPHLTLPFTGAGTISSHGRWLGSIGLSGGSTFASSNPVFTGTAAPGSTVTVDYQPPSVGTNPTVTADSNGNWSIQLHNLGNGVYPIYVTSVKDGVTTTSGTYYLTVDNPTRTT